MTKKLLIFDFDGVLCDSLDALVDAANTVMRRMGRAPTASPETIAHLDKVDFVEFALALGIPLESIPLFIDEVIHEADSRGAGTFAGMAELIHDLDHHWLCVNTSNAAQSVRAFLVHQGWGDKFVELMDKDFLGTKADRIVWALRRFEVAPQDTYMIGDTASDILYAKQAQVRSVGVTWGFQPRARLAQMAPDYLVSHPRELREAFVLEGIL